jgi:hypothetical protein
MTTPTTWIPITTRRPTEEDLPLLIVNGTGYGKGSVVEVWRDKILTYDFKHLTHWMKLPPPPPKERTQREEDEEACSKWWFESFAYSSPPPFRDWHAALAYRDAQNRADLEHVEVLFGNHESSQMFIRLRKRCGI